MVLEQTKTLELGPIIDPPKKGGSPVPKKEPYRYSSLSGLALILGVTTQAAQDMVDIAIQTLRRGLNPTP